jgi:hypothetical protein
MKKLEQNEVRKCLPSFSAEYFVFQFAIKKYKDIRNCNFACCFVWGLSCSLPLRKDHRMKVQENRVPWRIFGPQKVHIPGEWMRLYNEEFHGLYSSPNTIRVIKSRIREAGNVTLMGEERRTQGFE